MDGESKNTNLGLRHLMIGRHPRRPRARVESLDPGVLARVVNLAVYGHQKARAASQELAVLTVKESPFCRIS